MFQYINDTCELCIYTEGLELKGKWGGAFSSGPDSGKLEGGILSFMRGPEDGDQASKTIKQKRLFGFNAYLYISDHFCCRTENSPFSEFLP